VLRGRRPPGARHRLGPDGLCHRPRPLAAVLLRPAHAEVAGLVQLPVPHLALVQVPDLPRHVLLEPRADLLAERDVLGGVVEIHGGGGPQAATAGGARWVGLGGPVLARAETGGQPEGRATVARVKRRAFVKGAGAVVVVAAGGLAWRAHDQGVFAGESGSAFEPWRTWRGDAAEGPLALVRAA